MTDRIERAHEAAIKFAIEFYATREHVDLEEAAEQFSGADVGEAPDTFIVQFGRDSLSVELEVYDGVPALGLNEMQKQIAQDTEFMFKRIRTVS